MKRVGGIDARRPVPLIAEESFRSWFRVRPVRPDGEEVLLWVDTFTDAFAPEVGKAAV